MNIECVQCHKKYDGWTRFTHIVHTSDYFCERCMKYDQPERLNETARKGCDSLNTTNGKKGRESGSKNLGRHPPV